MFLFVGRDIFNLPYENETTPFYADQTYVDTHPGYQLEEPTPKLVLYTMTFQSFVFLQIFNQFNCRVLGDREFNVFKGIFNNKMFLIMFVLTVAI